jgi:hypothetical protein
MSKAKRRVKVRKAVPRKMQVGDMTFGSNSHVALSSGSNLGPNPCLFSRPHC